MHILFLFGSKTLKHWNLFKNSRKYGSYIQIIPVTSQYVFNSGNLNQIHNKF